MSFSAKENSTGSVVSNKMPTNDYRNRAGEKLTGTTTVISGNLGWNKQQLMWWAWSQGKEGKDFRKTVQAAADAGTIAHYYAECDIKRVPREIPIAPEETLKLAQSAYDAYLTWKVSSRVDIIQSEIPLVSERYQFGGTLDGIGLLNGAYCLIDFKTSNGTYSDHLIQLAAYRQLWDENHPDQAITGGFHLLRFGKEAGDFHHHYYPDLAMAWSAFEHLLGLQRCKRALAKLAA